MRKEILPELLCVFSIALLVWAFLSRAYVVAGLIFDIMGVIFLAWEEMTTAAGWLRLHTHTSLPDVARFWNHVKTLPRHRRYPVVFAVKFGPRDIMAGSQQSTDESFPRKFWGLGFLIVGFILQAVGCFQNVSCQCP